jgi:hypothetical protein
MKKPNNTASILVIVLLLLGRIISQRLEIYIPVSFLFFIAIGYLYGLEKNKNYYYGIAIAAVLFAVPAIILMPDLLKSPTIFIYMSPILLGFAVGTFGAIYFPIKQKINMT